MFDYFSIFFIFRKYYHLYHSINKKSMGKSSGKENWVVIVNPNAGHRKGVKDWTKISGLLTQYGISFISMFTESKHHAIELTRDAIKEGYRKFIVVGGDGTMNEVVNGVFTQSAVPTRQIIIGMITVGTGNDWGRMFGVPLDYEEAIKLLSEGKIFLQDTGIVSYYSGTKIEKRYFVNIAGLGFDALVVKRTNRQKDKGHSGKSLYYWNLIRSLFSYRYTKTDIVIDGLNIKNDTFSISLGIGRYSGGGMMQTPNAIPDDGLFDITIIKNMRKGEIIRSIKKLYDGTLLDHPKIEAYTGKNIKIDSDPLIHLEVDGESLGHSPIEFNIEPESIRVICDIDAIS